MHTYDFLDIVAGIDFSGAKTVPNETWLAIGKLDSMGVEITHLDRVGSQKIAQELSKVPGLAAAGFDFPFSLPAEFLQYLADKRNLSAFQSWQSVAECMAFLPYEEFDELAQAFVKEPKRYADKNSKPIAQSPLHRGNPSMLQMTYQGIRMLTTLNPEKFAVLPFQSVGKEMCQVIEVYPAATLAAGGVQSRGYKSKEKKDKDAMFAVRKQMIRQLMTLRESSGATLADSIKDCPRLSMSPKFESTAITSDHAFDAIVACYTTAIFVRSPKFFADPLDADNLDVLTEGWIYAPSFTPAQVKATKTTAFT
jgi:Protein of unknown function (DUF429)